MTTTHQLETESSSLTEMRLLIVDDEPANVDLLEQLLGHAGYTNLRSTLEATAVASLSAYWKPDLVLLDLHMPGRWGIEVMHSIHHLIQEPESLPVLVVSADISREARHEALAHGARDFVTKPIDHVELLLRVRSHLLTRQLQQQLQRRNEALDEAVRERTLELDQSRMESLTILASVAEHHDGDTHRHTQRVGVLAALIARNLGLPEAFVATIRNAAPLHDIGKIAIPHTILLKPGPLTDDERAAKMNHVEFGAQMLASAESPVLRLAAEIARTHHERWDGKGYLAGLAAEAIPISGRITAVADVFDALTHQRPYKFAWDPEESLREITSQAGLQFDPRVVQGLLGVDLGLIAEQTRLPPAHRHAASAPRLAVA